MNRKLSDWASVAEVISGIAVVITLIILILGVRANTEITRASVYANHIDSINDFESNLMRDPDLARIWAAFLGKEAGTFEGEDKARLNLMGVILFRIYEKAYFTRKYEIIGNSEWGRFERLICINYDRAKSAKITDTITVVMTEEFMQYINNSCKN